MKLLLIAGHGAGDPGAIGSGQQEADLTRDLVQRMYETAIEKGIDVIIFRMDTNMYQFLKHGGQFDFKPYDLVLEVHFNSSESMSTMVDGKLKGTMFYYKEGRTDLTVEREMLKSMIELGSVQAWDGLVPATAGYTGGLLVQNRVEGQGVHHVLMETLFVSDMDDIKFYFESKDAIAEAVINAIARVFGTSVLTVKKVANVSAGDVLNVRTGPGNEEPILPEWPYLSNGDLVDVLEVVAGGWYKVRIAGRHIGYVYGSYLASA